MDRNQLPIKIVGTKLRSIYGIKTDTELREVIETKFDGNVKDFLRDFERHRTVGWKLAAELEDYIEERESGWNMDKYALSAIPTITLLHELERRAKKTNWNNL
jgi:hypothetical protein